MMQTVYVAGSMVSAARIQKEALRLAKLDCIVVSRWFNPEHNSQTREFQAMGDIYGVLEANMVIFDTLEHSTSGGRSVELGLALAKMLNGHNVRIVRIGPSDNIFFDLVREVYPTWDDFFDHETGGYGSLLDHMEIAND